MTKQKTIEQKYQKLDEISHVLLRPGRYLGSVKPNTAEQWIVDSGKMVRENITTIPALLKIFDEVISNSVDFAKTKEGKHLNTIKVTLDQMTGEIIVEDNGGIAVVKHSEYDQYIPEMIFELRAGSNFDDTEDSLGTGQNGEGAALTAIFSTEFEVQTADGKNSFQQTRASNSREISVAVVKASSKNYTKIRFIPDYEKFGLEGMDEDNYRRLVKRVYDVAGCNPELKIFLNNERITIKSFQDYVGLYTPDFVHEENEHWRVALAHSDIGFNHVSFVNGTETTIGGCHIAYVSDQIVSKLREFLKKKHKVDVKPSDIKNHFTLFINADIIRPRYSSQTKEDLITEVKEFGTSIEISDKFIKKVIGSSIIQAVLDWVAAKAHAQEMADMRKLGKNQDKTNLRKISKFTDATEKVDRKNCMFFIAEGDSAAASILSARTSMIGCYPLKGKPINALAATIKELMENKEFTEVMTVLGLKIGQKVTSADALRFGKIVICSDADPDGSHIFGLMVAAFKHYWPEMLQMGMIYRFQTPIMKVIMGKDEKFFYKMSDFDAWAVKQTKVYKTRYLKGLGSSTAADFRTYFADMETNLVRVKIDSVSDLDIIDLVFGKETGAADRRKLWLDLE